MSRNTPFIDPGDGSLDVQQILVEAIPLAKLIALFGVIGFVPFAIASLLGPSGFGMIFSIAAQFAFAVGAGIVAIHVVTRGMQLSRE